MKLYTYFRSSAAYRVRIALGLKGLDPERAYVHLIRDGGQHRSAEYKAVNPQGFVPTLVVEDTAIGQSLAIVEYLDETHPEPLLLPGSALDRARIRSFAQTIACDIHPINNLRVLNYLKGPLGQAETDTWSRHWIAEGFRALEATARDTAGGFCFGDSPTLADVCLVPQMFNARRVGLDLSPFPTLARIDERCQMLPAFAEAHPDRQPDAS